MSVPAAGLDDGDKFISFDSTKMKDELKMVHKDIMQRAMKIKSMNYELGSMAELPEGIGRDHKAESQSFLINKQENQRYELSGDGKIFLRTELPDGKSKREEILNSAELDKAIEVFNKVLPPMKERASPPASPPAPTPTPASPPAPASSPAPVTVLAPKSGSISTVAKPSPAPSSVELPKQAVLKGVKAKDIEDVKKATVTKSTDTAPSYFEIGDIDGRNMAIQFKKDGTATLGYHNSATNAFEACKMKEGNNTKEEYDRVVATAQKAMTKFQEKMTAKPGAAPSPESSSKLDGAAIVATH